MIFRRAVLRLTIQYTIVQLVIFGAFALAVYLYVTGTFDYDAAEALGEGGAISAEQGFVTLGNALILAYAALIVLTPFASWAMARAAVAPVRRSYEFQQRFVDGASHEMRSPLSVIQGELELALTRPRSPAEYQAAITVAGEATATLVGLTDDLLLLSRGDSDDLSDSFSPVDVDSLIVDAVAGRTRTEAREADLELDCRSGARVIANRRLLDRALSNIVENALKFTPPSGMVTVSTHATSHSALIVVRDTGVGMSSTELRHAPDRFWRADSARSRAGHGLGLSLVDEIVRAHSGSLTLTSEPAVGTTVTIKLPRSV